MQTKTTKIITNKNENEKEKNLINDKKLLQQLQNRNF